jgi:membrane-associated phospholipid phosphatase
MSNDPQGNHWEERIDGLNLQSLLRVDARWSTRLRIAEEPGVLRSVAAVIAHSGDSWFWGIGLGMAWLMGDGSLKRWSLHLIGAIIVTAIIVLTIKFIVRRQRPEGEWGAIYRNTDPHSFPSGHAARGILLAVIVIGLGPGWLALALIIWAPLVAIARVAMGVHYLSDVFAGGFLGLAIGLLWLFLLT